jgi:hypothetical protein
VLDACVERIAVTPFPGKPLACHSNPDRTKTWLGGMTNDVMVPSDMVILSMAMPAVGHEEPDWDSVTTWLGLDGATTLPYAVEADITAAIATTVKKRTIVSLPSSPDEQ